MQYLIPLAQEGFFSFTWWQWLMIIILIGLIVLFFVLRKKG
jgi:hypothetical protein